MIKHICILALINIIGVVKFANCAVDCSQITSQTSCTNFNNCIWQADTTLDKCMNINLNCSQLSSNSKQCFATPGCVFQAGLQGFCNQLPSLGCSDQSMTACQANSKCTWTAFQDCQAKTTTFGCSGMNESQCNQNYQFCQPQYVCKDIDGQKCQNLGKQDCLDAKDYCDYAETTQEQCAYQAGFCENLLTDDCLSNGDFCAFNQSTPFTCVDNTSASICASKTPDDCLVSSDYCDQTIPACVQSVNCSAITDQNQCITAGCTYNTANNTCTSPVDCTTLNYSACTQNSSLCSQPTPTCSNKTTFNCASKTNRLDCKLNQQYCTYTPAVGTCAPSGMCTQLTGYECQFFQKECVYTPEVGSCTIKNGLGCSQKTRIDCLDFPYCVATFNQCGDMPGDVCTIMNVSECTQNGSQCVRSQQGSCSDALITCPTDKKTCLTNTSCEWVGEISDSCLISIDCTEKSSTECQQSSSLCNYLPGGTCIPVAEQTQVSARILTVSLIFSLILYFLII